MQSDDSMGPYLLWIETRSPGIPEPPLVTEIKIHAKPSSMAEQNRIYEDQVSPSERHVEAPPSHLSNAQGVLEIRVSLRKRPYVIILVL